MPGATVAVVAFLSSVESPKVVSIIQELRSRGHYPVLIDAQVFEKNLATIEADSNGRRISFEPGSGVTLSYADGVTGGTKNLHGTFMPVVLNTLPVITVDRNQPVLRSPHAQIGEPVTPVREVHDVSGKPLTIHGVWADGVDIERRFGLEQFFRELWDTNTPSLTPSWESIVSASLKNRTYQRLDSYHDQTGIHINRPRTIEIHRPNGQLRQILARIQEELGYVGKDGMAHQPDRIWVKATDNTHSQRIHLVDMGAGPRSLLDSVRQSLSITFDGELCIGQEDVLTVLQGPDGTLYRGDLAIVGLNRIARSATLRLNDDLTKPTNSHFGGIPLNIPLSTLHPEVIEINLASLDGLEMIYGGTDVVGGLREGQEFPTARGVFTVVQAADGNLCEINLTPGGRSPGFHLLVIIPQANYLLDAIALDRAGQPWRRDNWEPGERYPHLQEAGFSIALGTDVHKPRDLVIPTQTFGETSPLETGIQFPFPS
jgi:hypothetical protein